MKSSVKSTVAAKAEAKPKGLEPCLRCGEPMVETYCKSICQNCGYMHDCNDQW